MLDGLCARKTIGIIGDMTRKLNLLKVNITREAKPHTISPPTGAFDSLDICERHPTPARRQVLKKS